MPPHSAQPDLLFENQTLGCNQEGSTTSKEQKQAQLERGRLARVQAAHTETEALSSILFGFFHLNFWKTYFQIPKCRLLPMRCKGS